MSKYFMKNGVMDMKAEKNTGRTGVSPVRILMEKMRRMIWIP
jgi:hypothetical protein